MLNILLEKNTFIIDTSYSIIKMKFIIIINLLFYILL